MIINVVIFPVGVAKVYVEVVELIGKEKFLTKGEVLLVVVVVSEMVIVAWEKVVVGVVALRVVVSFGVVVA